MGGPSSLRSTFVHKAFEVRLTSRFGITAYIPDISRNSQEHFVVSVRGGNGLYINYILYGFACDLSLFAL